MNTLRLSICIATFNRASYIGETLDNLIAQITAEVEIVVLDGGSSDNTEEIVRARASACQRLRYIRQEVNQGVDRDFDRAVELAAGEYCWLMSDDDLLRAGAIRAVLEATQRNYSLILVNAEVKTMNMTGLLESRRLRFDSDRVYAAGEMDRLFMETGAYLTFIGCVVIRRAVWMGRQRELYYGSCFIHVGVIFQERLPHECLAISEPFISIRYGNATWTAKEFEIWMSKWPNLVWSLNSISEEAKSKLCPRKPWPKLKTLMWYRAKGTYSLREYRSLVKPRVSDGRRRFFAMLIAIIPGVLANGLAVFYYSTIYRESGMPLADVKKSRYYFGNWAKWAQRS